MSVPVEDPPTEITLSTQVLPTIETKASTENIDVGDDDSSGVTKKISGDVFNYNCALLADCSLFFNFLGAMKEGDGMRLVRQYKYFMLYCNVHDPHGTKYSLECLYQFFLCHLGTVNVLLGTGSKIIMVTKAPTFLSMRQQSAATIT